jgi:hypothetical protein
MARYRPEKDEGREERIEMEAVVDCYNEDERAMGWYSYLDDRLRFSFKARVTVPRATSPLKLEEKVEVLRMAPEDECEREMFVVVRWGDDELAVPLAQLEPVGADAGTAQAAGDWHYWVEMGYEL